MKKIRISLIAIATLGAILGAFASKNSMSTIGFEWQQAQEKCVQRTTPDNCNTTPSMNPCLVSGIPLRSVNDPANQCGPALYKH